MGRPRPVERREDPERLAVGLDDAARGHRVGRAGADERDLAQRRVHPLVPRGAVGPEVCADMHAGRAGVPGDGGNDVLGRAPPHDQLPAVLAQLGVQLAQALVEERQPGGARRPTQCIVEHEERDDPIRVGSSGQRRMVAQSQVAAEPHHRGRWAGHMASLPVIVLEWTRILRLREGTEANVSESDDLYVGGFEGDTQLDPSESLTGDNTEDPLDAGYSPPDYEPHATRYGTTAEEQWEGESLDQLLAEEEPDVSADDYPVADDYDIEFSAPDPRTGRSSLRMRARIQTPKPMRSRTTSADRVAPRAPRRPPFT